VTNFTRRTALRSGAGLAAAATLSPHADWLARAAADAPQRKPDSLPDRFRAAGAPDASMPFDHVVIVMQENHSFDNYFGMLPRRGQPKADGFSFDAAGKPTNANPYKDGYLVAQHATTHCQPGSVGQSWRSTHIQMDGGKMDGFPQTSPSSMLYWDQADLPFYYSLALTFCLGDRYFCSAPCQTYPNRRFLLAATAFGLISTDTNSLTQNPPNGTIVDRLDRYGITWKDYFTDVPATGVIESIPQNHPQNLATVTQFMVDCAAGTLPQVSFVDSDIGVLALAPTSNQVEAQNQDEENPSDISLGENFVSGVVNAVLKSPLWPRILLIWTYDEHGGYYDHVPPPPAIPPDDIKPQLGPNDPPGGYDVYGPRVPAVVVSGHAKPKSVTSVVHDHTSILATIQAKWNLPAMTYRDANATTLMDFLDASKVTFPEPPTLAAPSDLGQSEQNCPSEPETLTPVPKPPAGASKPSARGGLVARFYGRRREAHAGVVVTLNTRSGSLTGLLVELERDGKVVAKAHVTHVGTSRRRVALHPLHGKRFSSGGYTLVVRHGSRTLVRRRVRLR
jgi:phospholipase C